MTALVHSIHTSERKSYRGCRRRWHWIFRDMYYPKTTAKPLEFGVAYHKAMEVWYDPDFWNSPRDVVRLSAMQAFVDVCMDQRKKYTDQFGSIDPAVDEDFKERLELGRGMLSYYFDTVSPGLDVGFRPLMVEIPFKVPILDPAGNQLFCKCNVCFDRWAKANDISLRPRKHTHEEAYKLSNEWKGLPVTYGGRIDMLAEDDRGRYWIVDWKTAARLSDSREYLRVDDQITSYCWALQHVLNIPVAGFIYHEQKKGFPQPPEPNAHQRKGCWYSVSKQQDTTHDLYLQTILEGDPAGYDAGSYDEFLRWLREDGPKFYNRYQEYRTTEELEACGYNIYLEAVEMCDLSTVIYPNPGRFSCQTCAFSEPCVGMNRGEDYEYTLKTLFEKRKYHYWEDKEPSTDSKGGE